MDFSIQGLKALQTKLKTGNRRSVHLNAITGSSRYKFDLHNLASLDENLPELFIIDLLTNKNLKFKFSIQLGHKTVQKSKVKSENELAVNSDKIVEKILTGIENLLFQNETILSEKGINALGFGYPILVRKDMSDGKITASPLLIWSINIRPTAEMNTFEISRNEDDSIYLNEVLINHLYSDSNVSIDKITEEITEDGKIDKSELEKICSEILQKLKIDQDLSFISNNYDPIEKIKTKLEYEEILLNKGDGIILKSGLFSLFEVQKQNIINDYENLINHIPKEIKVSENYEFQSFTSITTDPSQQFILNELKSKEKIIIQGPPGTGKSQTLTAILLNCLENKQKALVVCEKQTALEVLLQALEKFGLKDFCILIKDTTVDRRIVVNKVREIIDSNEFKAKNELNSDSFDLLVKNLTELKNAINIPHHKLHEKILNQNWIDIITKIILYKEISSTIDFSTIPFQFNETEYQDLQNKLQNAEQTFTNYKQFSENKFLKNEAVSSISYMELLDKIRNEIENHSIIWREIEQLVQEFKSNYIQKRKNEFSNQLVKLESLQNELKISTSLLNPTDAVFDSQKTSSFFYKFLSFFSSSKKKTLQTQGKIEAIYKEILTISCSENFIPIEFTSDLWKNKGICESYHDKIETSKQNSDSLFLNDFNAIEFQNFQEHQDEIFTKLVEKINSLIKSLQSNLFYIKNELKSYSDLKIFVPQLISTYSTYNNHHLNPILLEYNWLTLENKFTNSEKNLFEKLKSTTNWYETFFHQYYTILLSKNTDSRLQFNSENYKNFNSSIEQFSNSQKNQIILYWKSKQLLEFKKFEKQNPEITVANLYNKRSSIQFRKLSLRQIIVKDIDLFTSFFPIILTTPDACSNMFEGKKEYFDYVIFDEASQLKIEETLPALTKGKKIIIAGDEHQMPPSNYFSKVFDGEVDDEEDLEENEILTQKDALLSLESLLDFGLENNFEKNYLDFHYRSKHPLLIEFSNHAFYNGRLKPLPSLIKENPIIFHQIDGVFDEHINVEETEKVLQILENIQPNENGNYPSVGVATFNITQRNHIKRKITQRKNDVNYPSFGTKIAELEKAGLFIKNLENIQGDERDILILSTTYGNKKTGKFIQSFGPINHSKGYKLLNVIITRAKEKIHICTSIPQEYYLNYKNTLSEEGENNRKAIFYTYLNYCKAVSENDQQKIDEVLQEVKKYSSNAKITTNSNKSELKNLILTKLQSKIPSVEVHLNYTFGGYQIDIFLENETKKVAIELLSKDKYQNDIAYLEDLHKEKIISNFNINYHRLWLQDWWKNKEIEIQKINFLLDTV